MAATVESLVEWLSSNGHLSDKQRKVVENHMQRNALPLRESLIATNTCGEAELLKWLATQHRTQYLATDKLARAAISKEILGLLSRGSAERLKVIPVLFDKRNATITVACPQPSAELEGDILGLIRSASMVKLIVCRQSAIEAAIRKHYIRDPNAFALINQEQARTANMGIRPIVNMQRALSEMAQRRRQSLRPTPAQRSADGSSRGSLGDSPFDEAGTSSNFLGASPFDAPAPAAPPVAAPPIAAPPMAAPPIAAPPIAAPPIAAPPPAVPSPVAIPAPAPAIPAPSPAATPAAPPPPPPKPVPKTPTATEPQPRSTGDMDSARQTFVETVNIFMSLLEKDRALLRGHSSQVASLSRRVCVRLNSDKDENYAIILAAFLHDIGKTNTPYHLTSLNVAEYDGHRSQAAKVFQFPIRMFESAKLPTATKDSLLHMYEKYDGTGFPDGLAGADIPLGARVLALTETYVDLTTNPKNPFRNKLNAKEACDALMEYQGGIFDPALIHVLIHIVLGDDLKARLLSHRHRVLLVDPNQEETTVLEMKLLDLGMDVEVARTPEEAKERLARPGIELIITEIDFPNQTGDWLDEVTRGDVPVIVHTSHGDEATVAKGFSLEVKDYLVKPTSPAVVAAKAVRAMETVPAKAATRSGVSGSLSEMSLPDMVQILSNGRKTCRLSISAGGDHGHITFNDGWIFDAHFGKHEAAEAFYAMLMLEDGDFNLDPTFVSETRTIQGSVESLLLEGMRRLDENNR